MTARRRPRSFRAAAGRAEARRLSIIWRLAASVRTPTTEIASTAASLIMVSDDPSSGWRKVRDRPQAEQPEPDQRVTSDRPAPERPASAVAGRETAGRTSPRPAPSRVRRPAPRDARRGRSDAPRSAPAPGSTGRSDRQRPRRRARAGATPASVATRAHGADPLVSSAQKLPETSALCGLARTLLAAIRLRDSGAGRRFGMLLGRSRRASGIPMAIIRHDPPTQARVAWGGSSAG